MTDSIEATERKKSARSSMVFVFLFLAAGFLAYAVLSPQPKTYKIDRTEMAEVISILPSTNRYDRATASFTFRLQDGTVAAAAFPTRYTLIKGQTVKIDVLEAKGMAPRYRLAQDPFAP